MDSDSEQFGHDSASDRQGPSNAAASYSDDAGSDVPSSPDTEDQIADAKFAKSKRTLKRKRRATEPSQFGATLQSLLNTDAPSALPLSLKPSILKEQRKEKQLDSKVKKALRAKKDKEDKERIRDVIGGWGAERERGLRKVAQRGGKLVLLSCVYFLTYVIVVQLFNAIQQAHAAAEAALEEAKASKGTGKPTLPAPIIEKRSKSKGKFKDAADTHAESACP
jgi:hypothetical protein